MDISSLLTNAGSQDASVRQPAELQLRGLEQSNWAAYLGSLCQALANSQAQPRPRQLAGLLLKNALVSKDINNQQLLAQKWLLLDQTVRTSIQGLLVKTLADPVKDIRNTAALVIGKIAAVEIPKQLWTTLVDGLVHSILDPKSTADLKEASFQALGYVCEECPQHLQGKSNVILNAIAQGMFKDQKNNEIKLAATRALSNSLEFAKANFSKQKDRTQILTMVFQATQSEHLGVREASFNCLVDIATVYYDFMPEYIKNVYLLTGKAIQSFLALTDPAQIQAHEPIALQAIEFWSGICEVEKTRIAEAEEATSRGVQPQRPVHMFAKQSLPTMIPLILQCLTRQSDSIDDDTWGVAKAAGVALDLFAATTRDDIVKVVLPFVEKNIQNPNWRFREAGTLAFGCILEGPSSEGMKPYVTKAFGFILNFLKDQSLVVRDTAAWTIGRICDVLPDCIDDAVLPALMSSLHSALSEPPQIAAHVCWAIHNLAEAVVVDDDMPTSPLSKYFEGIVAKLIEITERQDAVGTNLVSSAYEAINAMVNGAARDMHGLIQKLIAVLLNKLKTTITQQGLTSQEREKQIDIQGLLCASLQSIIHKLDKTIIQQNADALMQVFLQVLQSQKATVHEDALMAIGAVADKLGILFEKYMTHFKNFLMVGLRNFKEYQVCTVAVGVVGDLCRALEGKMLPYCDGIMQLLLQNLQNHLVQRSVKPHIISCIGDVALAVGAQFERYLPFVMMLLVSASQLTFKPEEMTLDTIDYLNFLRASILEAYTGIIQGLSSGNKAQLFIQFLPHTVGFLDLVARDQTREDVVLANAVGLIGDLASLLDPSQSQQALRHPSIAMLVKAAQASPEEKTQERGRWAGQFCQELFK